MHDDNGVARKQRIKELKAKAGGTTERRGGRLRHLFAVTGGATTSTVCGNEHTCELVYEPTPTPLAHALRSGSPEAFQRVRLTVQGESLLALVDGAAADIDLPAERAVWDWLVANADDPPVRELTRLVMPARLLGVAWPDETIAISMSLSGCDVIDARKALRPRRRHPMLRALAVLLLPCGTAGTGKAAGVLRFTQAATSAATAAGNAALPMVTAAAISGAAVSSCAPQISMDFTARPGHGRHAGASPAVVPAALSDPVRVRSSRRPKAGPQPKKKLAAGEEADREQVPVQAPAPAVAPEAPAVPVASPTPDPTPVSSPTPAPTPTPTAAPTVSPTPAAPADAPTPTPTEAPPTETAPTDPPAATQPPPAGDEPSPTVLPRDTTPEPDSEATPTTEPALPPQPEQRPDDEPVLGLAPAEELLAAFT